MRASSKNLKFNITQQKKKSLQSMTLLQAKNEEDNLRRHTSHKKDSFIHPNEFYQLKDLSAKNTVNKVSKSFTNSCLPDQSYFDNFSKDRNISFMCGFPYRDFNKMHHFNLDELRSRIFQNNSYYSQSKLKKIKMSLNFQNKRSENHFFKEKKHSLNHRFMKQKIVSQNKKSKHRNNVSKSSYKPLSFPDDIPYPDHEMLSDFDFKYDLVKMKPKRPGIVPIDNEINLTKRESNYFDKNVNRKKELSHSFSNKNKNNRKNNEANFKFCNEFLTTKKLTNQEIRIQMNSELRNNEGFESVKSELIREINKLKGKFKNWITFSIKNYDKNKINEKPEPSSSEIGKMREPVHRQLLQDPLVENIIWNSMLQKSSNLKYALQLKDSINNMMTLFGGDEQIVYHKENIFTIINSQVPMSDQKFKAMPKRIRLRVVCMLFAKYINYKKFSKICENFWTHLDFNQVKTIQTALYK